MGRGQRNFGEYYKLYEPKNQRESTSLYFNFGDDSAWISDLYTKATESLSLPELVFIGADPQAPDVFTISVKGSVAEIEEKRLEIDQTLKPSGFCLDDLLQETPLFQIFRLKSI
jgi:hypothetical protein